MHDILAVAGGQAARSLAAGAMLGGRLLLRPGFVAGLVSLIRPAHLASLAAWHQGQCLAEGEEQENGHRQNGHAPAAAHPPSPPLPVLVAAVLHEGVQHAQPQALRDILQVRLRGTLA